MANESPPEFAVIGHQDSWQDIRSIINGMRSEDKEPLSLQKIMATFGYIPPRGIFTMKARSKTGKTINGIYIETFIDPDELGLNFLRKNIKKVNEAIALAQKLGAKIMALGGFTSIVLEGNIEALETSASRITTGNTLTSAFILKGIEKAAQLVNAPLADSSVLVIGATGDIGMACTKYLKGKTKWLLLCARNAKRLEQYANQLSQPSGSVKYSTRLNELIAEADIIISAASSAHIEIKDYKKPVIICDAGYPKNLDTKITNGGDVFFFHGGMGTVNYGYEFHPDYRKYFYKYPSPHIAHGCILEAVVLAFEEKYENYSVGKGNINPEKIDEIHELSLKHGVELAPFYNAHGLVGKTFNIS